MRELFRDPARLGHILESIDRIFDFTRGVTLAEFQRNTMMKFAVIKNLEIIGEAAYMLTDEFKKSHSEVNWMPVIKMRHVLVHGYYQIRDEIVWEVIQNDLVPLREKIIGYLEEI